jgi:hypothetical protein
MKGRIPQSYDRKCHNDVNLSFVENQENVFLSFPYISSGAFLITTYNNGMNPRGSQQNPEPLG